MRRFFAFPLVRMVAIIAIFIGIAFCASAARLHGDRAATAWIALALLAAIVLIVERLTVHRGPAEIGFDPRHIVRDTLLGFVAGAVLFSLVIFELMGAGAYRIETVQWSNAVLYAALWILPSAAVEEVLFRGVLFRLLAEWSGTWIALAISALLFGASHLLNPGATWFAGTAIAIEAGVLLGAAFVATRSLWFPIALHFAWNFFEGPFYGTQLSGTATGHPVIRALIEGPAWLTGGAFGPEASVPAILTCSAAAVALLIYAARTGSIVPCPWFRKGVTT
ncbi:MAG TPA: CPBP family intramembrane glutamic endopeptidase [Candidatus Acidoferrales bacterium]|nr:CPBP family intramembrane glutamic endopeptidase [Candidatus Acidoferrales bacterium]